MKVLSKKDWSSWKIECACKKCEAKLEIGSEDIKCGNVYADDGHNRPGGHYFYVNCCECHDSIVISPASIPAFLQDEARKRASAAATTSWYDR